MEQGVRDPSVGDPPSRHEDGAMTSGPGTAAPIASKAVSTRSGRLPGRLIAASVAMVVIGLAAYFAYPLIDRSLNTISTDDAYVNGHVTFVASRVAGQVERV